MSHQETENKNEAETILDRMFDRINNISEGVARSNESDQPQSQHEAWDFGQPSHSAPPTDNLQTHSPVGKVAIEEPETCLLGEFHPLAPMNLEHAKIQSEVVEGILLRFLLGRGAATIRTCSEVLKLNYCIVQPIVRFLKDNFLVEFTGTDSTNDYLCRLTDEGKAKALKHSKTCSYVGPSPVSLSDYVASVHQQTIAKTKPSVDRLQAAFDGLSVNEKMLHRIGPAVNSAKGLFLFGSPGNGKTSIAERISMAYGEMIWIPHAIQIEGEIVRLFDPSVHQEVPLTDNETGNRSGVDNRWVRVRRSTVVVGGELTLDMLDIRPSNGVGVSEAPVQMKSNCGVLVIDDFGRQRCSVEELLNRWIIPLEKRYDFLNTVSGHRICMPFDQLVIFSTNLQPADLVDEAFLRRIPYKIEVVNPSVEQFKEIWIAGCQQNGLEFREEIFEYLLEKCYRATGREMRMCHPRDLIHQVVNFCQFSQTELEITRENLDIAIDNYFSALG